jgi:endonuclease-3 related protein
MDHASATDVMKRTSIARRSIRKKLLDIYRALYRAYGSQHWWPGDTAFEMMVGALLTQNTAWVNVEKAIANLKRERLLTVSRLHGVPKKKLALLIRPSGYFNIKTKRLKHLLEFIRSHYAGSLKKMFAGDPETLRRKLLDVNGIGPETADCILLYAGEKPFFVVDAYTKRVFSRHGFISDNEEYHAVQQLFIANLPRDARMFNEYHALIVRVGKEYCKKGRPLCNECPLEILLP